MSRLDSSDESNLSDFEENNFLSKKEKSTSKDAFRQNIADIDLSKYREAFKK